VNLAEVLTRLSPDIRGRRSLITLGTLILGIGATRIEREDGAANLLRKTIPRLRSTAISSAGGGYR
jgi:hypothetical protein